MPKPRTFLHILSTTFIAMSAVLCPLVLSCSGNGGVSNMEGDIYNPMGGGSGTGANGGTAGKAAGSGLTGGG